MFLFLFTLFRVGFFLPVAYLTVANLARLGISVHCNYSTIYTIIRQDHDFVFFFSHCFTTPRP